MSLTQEEIEAEVKQYEFSANTKRLITWTSLIYVLVALFVGVPIWWRTTSTYRAWLPTSDIQSLTVGQESNVMLSVRIVVLSFDTWVDADKLVLLEQQLFDSLAETGSSNSSRLTVRYFGLVRHCVGHELELLRTSLTLDELEAAMIHSRTIALETPNDPMNKEANFQAQNFGDTYYFIVLPTKTKLLPQDKGLASTGVIRSGTKIVFLRSTGEINTLQTTVLKLINKVFVKEDELMDIFAHMRHTKDTSSTTQRERLRQFKSSSAYDITLTLVNPRPDLLNATWNLKEELRLYLDPFISRLSRYIHVTVSSQMLYSVDLENEARQSFQATEETEQTASNEQQKSKYYYYRAEDLPHLINPLEKYLANQVTGNPHINLVVYIPSPNRSPLHLHNEANKRTENNAFLSPQWGGLLVYNPTVSGTTTEGKLDVHVEGRKIMRVFVPLLKTLLGVKRRVPRIITPFEPNDISGVSAWEIDAWLRRRSLENLAIATHTLSSLVDLLDKVANMVISDEIAARVYRSVDSLKLCREYLQDGNLPMAFLASKNGLQAAEKAFFDESLLELLYFQDDQKYGIYMPLFVPLGLPLIISLFSAIKFLRKDYSEKKKTS